MDSTTKSKWQVRAAAVVIFVLGFAAGSLALNVYKRWARPNEQGRQTRFERMLDNLQLSADQKTQVHQILGDTRAQLNAVRKESEPRVAEIRRQADERLQQVLTPEQWKQFQQERDAMRARGRRGGGGPREGRH
ncbi:MAG TPA: periplasmic heavy metal sensor [Pyrinomonadaceae bacterium]|nr:periplasmic heavy metal sensor [Pyrinomonadaceae bacterium]